MKSRKYRLPAPNGYKISSLTLTLTQSEDIRSTRQNGHRSITKGPPLNSSKRCLVGNLICRLHQGDSLKTVKHQRMVTSYPECILHKINGHIKQIFKWYNSVNEIDINNIWTEPESKKGSTKSLFNCLCLTSFCLSSGRPSITLYIGSWWEWSNGHI